MDLYSTCCGSNLCHHPGVDIFDEKLQDATIQTVIDDLLKSAHATIRGDQNPSNQRRSDQRPVSEQRPSDPEQHVLYKSRHDAVPLYYLRPDESDKNQPLPEKITMAVHTSGYRDGYRFRIVHQPSTKDSTKKLPNVSYAYGKGILEIAEPRIESNLMRELLKELEKQLKEDFRPRWEGAPTFICITA